jgi:hypothetical protein
MAPGGAPTFFIGFLTRRLAKQAPAEVLAFGVSRDRGPARLTIPAPRASGKLPQSAISEPPIGRADDPNRIH